MPEPGDPLALRERSLVRHVGWQQFSLSSRSDLGIGGASIGADWKIVDCAHATIVHVDSGEDRLYSRQADRGPSG